jgi:4'-phosphopantetheinyl transferase
MNIAWTLPSLDEVDVWRLDLNSTHAAAVVFASRLDEAERARAERFRVARARAQFERSRSALRALLGRYLGRSAAALRLTTGAHGKPQLADGALHFNVSHAGRWALIAIARRPLGIDIEQVRALSDLDGLCAQLHPSEAVFIREVADAEQRQRRFLACWTAKEAALKALGCGLLLPLASFAVPNCGQPLCLPGHGTLWLTSLDAPDDMVAALATPWPAPILRRFDDGWQVLASGQSAGYSRAPTPLPAPDHGDAQAILAEDSAK